LVCHRILIKNWVRELQQFPRDAFEYGVLLTQSEQAVALQYCDLVFTTYSAVATAYARPAGDALRGALFGTEWRRVVADEAHTFVSMRTERAVAMLALRARSKWVLSGTPVQNRPQDLVTFLHFVGLSGRAPPSTPELRHLRQRLMLRRTRAQLAGSVGDGVAMPHFRQATRRVEQVAFATTAERLLYCLYAKYAQERLGGGGGMRVTQLILVMRQLCLCPAMVKALVVPRALPFIGSRRSTGQQSSTLREAMALWSDGRHALRVTYREGDGTVSAFVWEPERALAREQRAHYHALHAEFARAPGQWALTQEAVERCATQPQDVNETLIRHLMQHTLRLDMPSSKEAAALRHINEAASRGDKLIVYSNYVEALRSLQRWLLKAGHRCVLVTGQTGTQEHNDSLLQEFECQADIRVLLMTLKLGAEGLNIECANWVLFLDLWWNPFACDQGEQRVQRAGQRKDVHIVYLVMQHSVEQHMLRVAERKRAMLSALLSDEAAEVAETEEAELSEQQVSELFDYTVEVEPIRNRRAKI
jgi:SNF2 family DNA or RNA helicase